MLSCLPTEPLPPPSPQYQLQAHPAQQRLQSEGPCSCACPLEPPGAPRSPRLLPAPL